LDEGVLEGLHAELVGTAEVAQEVCALFWLGVELGHDAAGVLVHLVVLLGDEGITKGHHVFDDLLGCPRHYVKRFLVKPAVVQHDGLGVALLAVNLVGLCDGAVLHAEDLKIHGGLAAIGLVDVVKAGLWQVLEVVVLLVLGDPREARGLKQDGEGRFVGRDLVARSLTLGIALGLEALDDLGVHALEDQRVGHDALDDGAELCCEHFDTDFQGTGP